MNDPAVDWNGNVEVQILADFDSIVVVDLNCSSDWLPFNQDKTIVRTWEQL